MKVLISGTSGSGKSTTGKLLCADGQCYFIEADEYTHYGRSIAFYRSRRTGEGANHVERPLPPGWIEEYDWVWRIDLLSQVMDSRPERFIVVAGDAHNRDDALSLFDKIFVLYANDDALAYRITHREGNDFGKLPAEIAWIIEDNKDSAERAKTAGACLIDTTGLTKEQVIDICKKEMGIDR